MKTIKIFADTSAPDQVVDANAGTGSSPQAYAKDPLQFDIVIGEDGAVYLPPDTTLIRVEVFDAQNSANAALMKQDIGIDAIDFTLNEPRYKKGNVHGSVKFSEVETDLNLAGASTKNFWLKISFINNDGQITACAGTIVFNSSPKPSTNGPRQVGNLVAGGASYSAGGAYVVNVTPGKTYRWTKGAHDTSVTNGAETITVSNSIFTAQGATITLNGSANQTVTAVVWDDAFYDAAQSDARYLKKDGTEKFFPVYCEDNDTVYRVRVRVVNGVATITATTD